MTLQIVIDFAEGADPEAVDALAAELAHWTQARGFTYGAREPRVQEVEASESRRDGDG